MKALFIVAAGLSLSTLTPAHAESWYVGGQIGYTNTSEADWEDSGLTGDFEFDDTVNFGVALGKRINDNVRTEIELSYRKADMEEVCFDGIGCGSTGLSGDLKTTLLMLNVYYDFTAKGNWKPYVSAGIGAANHDGSISATNGVVSASANADDTVFAYQLGAGINYSLSETTDIGVGYRFVSSADAQLDSMKGEYAAQEVNLTLRYKF